jgi:quinol monooxygenase YgiN
MSQLVVVVQMVVHKGRAQEAIAGLAPAIEKTHDEPGCVLCALHQDIHDPDTLVLIEQWDSEESHDLHVAQDYIRELVETVSPLVVDLPKITVSTALSLGRPHKRLI